MPNLVEQADLVKRLTNDQLAAAMQNPTGVIAPFIFAAEAARRQAIQQQFSGGPKESVVDSLTKQLANVPQNIPAPTRTPPMVPPTPPMEGVAALQAQQAIAEMAQQPQAMRGGGMVQRYNDGGLGFRGRQGAGGYAPGEEPAGFGVIPRVFDYVTPSIEAFLENMRRYGPNMSPQDVEEAAERIKQAGQDPDDPRIKEALSDPFKYGMTGEDRRVAGKIAPERTVPPESGTSPAESAGPAPGETEEEFRERMRALLAPPELSDWEKAQKYFEMAKEFFDPSKTTMQSIAGAGQAFAQSAAEQAKARREAEFNLEKAMLEMDMAERDRRIAAQTAERERTSLSANQQADILIKSQESSRRILEAKMKRLDELNSALIENPMAAKMDPSISGKIASLQEEIAKEEQRLLSIDGALAALGEQAYGPISFEPYSLRSGFVR